MPRFALCTLGLCALSAAGGAAAQSSATLFGVVDAAMSRYSVRSQSWDGGPARAVRQSRWEMSPSGNFASRFGIRATEDLGDGLSAGFWLEAPVTNDTGANPLSFGRRSTLSLSGALGELRLGRDHTPSFLNDWAFDPFTSNGVGVNLIAVVSSNLAISRALETRKSGPLSQRLLGGGLSAGTDNYLRSSNSVGYFLPTGLGGVYGQAMFAFPEDPQSQRGRYAGARLGWAGGPADLALGYGESTLGNSGASDEKIRSLNFGASYNFGPAKLLGEWSLVRNARRDGTTLAPIDDRYRGLLVGATVPVGAGLWRAAYSRVRFTSGQGTGDASADKFALGYVHHLSRRTALYATVARIGIVNGRHNTAVMAVTPLVVSNPSILPQPTYQVTDGMQARSATGVDIGLRTVF